MQDTYTIPDQKAYWIAEGLLNAYKICGKPDFNVDSMTFWKFLGQIIQVWSKQYPEELQEFKKSTQLERDLERSVSLSARKGFKNVMSWPPTLYCLIKVFFRDSKLNDKKFMNKFLSVYPLFKTTNTVNI